MVNKEAGMYMVLFSATTDYFLQLIMAVPVSQGGFRTACSTPKVVVVELSPLNTHMLPGTYLPESVSASVPI